MNRDDWTKLATLLGSMGIKEAAITIKRADMRDIPGQHTIPEGKYMFVPSKTGMRSQSALLNGVILHFIPDEKV